MRFPMITEIKSMTILWSKVCFPTSVNDWEACERTWTTICCLPENTHKNDMVKKAWWIN